MTERIHIPTFDATVVLMADTDRSNVRRFVRRNSPFDIENLDDDFSGMTFDMGNMEWLVYIPNTQVDDGIWLVRTLSHEANHVVLQLMRRVGVQDDETVCYTQDCILGMMLEKIYSKRESRGRGRRGRRKGKDTTDGGITEEKGKKGKEAD